MTFGVSRDQGAFEWAGASLSSVFAQPANLLRPKFWRMLYDIIRFNQLALSLLSDAYESEEDPTGSPDSKGQSTTRQESIGHYLEREEYSEAFKNDYLIPMTACVWSTSPDKAALNFPAVTLVRFMWNHHLLNTISPRVPWMTIKEGTQQYIEAVLRSFPNAKIHLGKGVKSVLSIKSGQVDLSFQDGDIETFDHVVLATHGDQAMEIMKDVANPEEKTILSHFKTSRNTAVLHSDRSVRPELVHHLIHADIPSS